MISVLRLRKFFIVSLIAMTIMIVIVVGFFFLIMRGIFNAHS